MRAHHRAQAYGDDARGSSPPASGWRYLQTGCPGRRGGPPEDPLREWASELQTELPESRFDDFVRHVEEPKLATIGNEG